MYQNVPIEQVVALTYLGVTFHQTHGLYRGYVKTAKVKGYKALWAYTVQLRRRRLRTPDLVRRLFSILVEPSFSYGCQIWGPDVFGKVLGDPMATELQAIQSDFLRSFSGLGKSAHRATLVHEFGMQPVSHHWVVLAVRLWNRLIKMQPAHRLMRQAFEDNIQLFLQGCRGCWVWKVVDAMSTLGFVGTSVPQLTTVPQLMALVFDEKEVAEKLHARFLAPMADVGQQDPQSAGSQCVLAATYVNWVGMGPESAAPHAHVGLPYVLRRALISLRVGAHVLEVVTGRFRRVARVSRICKVCQGGNDVEDVRHFLLECPAYQAIRARYQNVFQGLPVGGSQAVKLKHLFCTSQQLQLAKCVCDMFKHREHVLAEEGG
jgi:hypothetical protein